MQSTPNKYTAPIVALVNHSGSGATDAQIASMVGGLQRQLDRDFEPYYNLTATVIAINTPPPTAWVIGFFKDADQPGALGYHDMTPHGTPLAKIFPILDAKDGAKLSVTVSHEILEMIADPYLSKCVQAADGRFWAYEVCDACEDDEYDCDGLPVSNFVTPHYFEPPADMTGIKLDQMGLVKKPYEVRPGGYMQWSKGAGWHQTEHADEAGVTTARRPYRAQIHGRADRRARRSTPR